MAIFWCMFIVMIVVELATNNFPRTKRLRLIKCILYGGCLTLVLGVRSPQNGVDLIGYLPYFGKISQLSIKEAFVTPVTNYEQGFIVYDKLVSLISTDYHFYLFITAVVTIGLISVSIYKFSTDIFLSFIIFSCFGLYTMCFSGLRQSMAYAITFVSFYYLVKCNPLKFALLVLLASTFHKSAIIFIFSWFIRGIKLPASRGIQILALYALIVLPIMRIVALKVTELIFGSNYSSYYNSDDGGGAVTMAIVYAIVFCGSYLIKARETPLLQILRWMVLFSVMTQSLGLISAGALPRIAYYFNIFYCLFIPQMLSELKQSRRGMTVLATILFIIFFAMSISTGYLNIVPYHFFWEPGWENPPKFMW